MSTGSPNLMLSAVSATGDGFRAFTPAGAPAGAPTGGSSAARGDASSSSLPGEAAAESAGAPDLDTAVNELASRAAESGAALDFRIDQESGRVVVSVVDRRDGTVLRQMPSEEALRIARNLARFEPHLIEVQA